MATTINNVAYSWSMIQLTSEALTGSVEANPTILSGVTAISWNTSVNVQTNYGLGGLPVNRGFGNTTYEASITLDYNAQVQLRNLMGSLMNLGEFDLIISWASDLGVTDLTTETVTLKGCFFSEDGMTAEQDDTTLTKEFDLHPFSIECTTSA